VRSRGIIGGYFGVCLVSVILIALLDLFGLGSGSADKTFANPGSVAVAGQAAALNTGSKLDFTAHSANVIIDDTYCQFSGYAWSEDWGWIAFGAADNPDGPVYFDPTSGVVFGIARVLSTNTTLNFNAVPYGSRVQIAANGNFSGYAWSEEVGWFNFAGVSAPGITFGGTLPAELPEVDILPQTGMAAIAS